MDTTHSRLLAMLDSAGVPYDLTEHPSEGRTDIVSRYRNNKLADAAKCLVIRVRKSRRERQYVLAVVPGDRRVDLHGLRELFGGTHAGFAELATAERLAGCLSGCIVPFSFRDDLELVVDPTLLDRERLYFNAARLDQSIALDTVDYLALARPRVAAIAAP